MMDMHEPLLDEKIPDAANLKTLKRKRAELKLLKLEQDIKSQTIDNNEKELTQITKITAEYDQFCRSTTLDEKARVIFKDIFLNMLTNRQSYTQNYQQTTTPEVTITPAIPKAESPGLDIPQPIDEGSGTTATDEDAVRLFKDDIGKQSLREKKKSGFSLRDIIQEWDLDLDPALIPAICKTVCTRFKKLRPESQMFSKMRRTFFFQQDRSCLETILQEEYINHTLRRATEKHNGVHKQAVSTQKSGFD